MSLNVCNDQLKELSSGRDRLATVLIAEDLIVLDERLQLLDRLLTEIHRQISLRHAEIQRRLERWSEFEEQCRLLMEAIAKCESAVEGVSDLTIDDLIVFLQTVSRLRNIVVTDTFLHKSSCILCKL